MVTKEHTQFEHHLMEREAAMAPKLEEYLQSFVKLLQQNELVNLCQALPTSELLFSRMGARVKEMGEKGVTSKHKSKMLDLQLVEAKEKLQAMTNLTTSLEDEVEGLKLELVQAADRVKQ